MAVGIGFLKVDLIIQRILLVIYLIAGFFGFVINSLFLIALITQLVIGGWQVLSSIIFSVSGNKKRVPHLIAVVCYFILLACGFALLEKKILDESVFLFVIGMVIVPIIIAAWYYTITNQHYKELIKNPREVNISKLEMEDILDSEELY